MMSNAKDCRITCDASLWRSRWSDSSTLWTTSDFSSMRGRRNLIRRCWPFRKDNEDTKNPDQKAQRNICYCSSETRNCGRAHVASQVAIFAFCSQERDRFPYCLHPELRLLLYHRCALYHASRACRNRVDYLQPDVTLRPKIHTRLVFFEGHGATSASLLLVCRLLYLEAGPVFGHYLCLKTRSIYPYRALDLPGIDQADVLSLPPRCTVSSLRHLHLEWYVTSREWARRVKPFPAIIQLLGQRSELRTIHFSLTIASAVLFQSPYLGPTGRLRKVESEMMLVIQLLPPAAELRALVFEGIFHKDRLETVTQERPNLKVLRGIPFEPPVSHPYSPEDDTPVSGQSESDLHLETTDMIDSNEDSDEGDRDELEQCE